MLPHELLQSQVQVERSLLSRVMAWLALSLALTAGGVYLFVNGFGVGVNPWIFLIAAFGLIFAIQATARSKNRVLAGSLFAVFSVVEGLFIAPVISYYAKQSPDAVGQALLGTVGIFLVAAAVVYLTSINLASWGRWLLGALLVGIVLSVATLFFRLPISTLAISAGLGVVFVGLTFYDFWRVKAERAGDNNALLLALSLYLDFINIFLILLRIFGRRN
ncbi:MAG: Bax inhibitor-1/YccA family protein [Candidatus Dormibacteraeota bacterium]|nr:Bax inhibitor-1/YccA family protein [Candidatus Dormibacteraeota bacterium]